MKLSQISLLLSWGLLSVLLGRAAIYEDAADLEDIDFDFIIIGGLHQLFSTDDCVSIHSCSRWDGRQRRG
jgi:hypothetical protein